MLEEIFNIIDYVAKCGNALMFKKMINIVGEFFICGRFMHIFEYFLETLSYINIKIKYFYMYIY